MLAVQSYVPVVLVSNSPESYLPLALIFSTTELVTSVSHFSSENSLKVILPSPVGSTRPEIVAVSLIFSPTVTEAVASVVIFGAPLVFVYVQVTVAPPADGILIFASAPVVSNVAPLVDLHSRLVKLKAAASFDSLTV